MTSSVTLHDLYVRWNELLIAHPGYRVGQALFNALAQPRPDLAEEMRTTGVDPFYVDDQVGGALLWLYSSWYRSDAQLD